MTLLEHFADDSSNRVSAHGFARSILAVVLGHFTRAQLISFHNLNDTAGNDKDQIDELVANYNGAGNATSKLSYIYLLEGMLLMYESGSIDEAKVKSVLGLV